MVHVGCVIVPTTGLTGAVGIALITTFEVAVETQPVATLVTVKLYEVDGANPVIVWLDVFPLIFPGLIVQLPDGNPLNTTLPVGVVHVGCVIVPTTGLTGAVGIALITTLIEEDELHPFASVAIKLYVALGNNPVTV